MILNVIGEWSESDLGDWKVIGSDSYEKVGKLEMVVVLIESV